MSERPDIMPPVMQINRFCEFSGFGRTTIYKLIGLGELESVRMCRRRFIVMAAESAPGVRCGSPTFAHSRVLNMGQSMARQPPPQRGAL